MNQRTLTEAAVESSQVVDATPANAPATIEKKPESSLPSNIEGDIYDSQDALKHLWQLAGIVSKSKLVPAAYQNSQPDCFLALHTSRQLSVDPFMFMQKSYVVKGKLGIEAQMAIGIINQARGPYKHGVRFRYEGEKGTDARRCIAWGERKDNGEIDEAECSIKMAKDSGWWGKADSWWPRLPEQMLAYRAAMFLARKFCPHMLLGLATIDELRDMYSSESPSPVGKVAARLSQITAEVV